MIWKKEVKRTDDHCIFFDLVSDWDFSNTVKSFIFVGLKFRGFRPKNVFVDIQFRCFFLPTKITKLNPQRKFMILQY